MLTLIPYAQWHMLLRGFEGGGWGEKRRSVSSEREARGRACFFGSFSKWWEGMLKSPIAHTLQKDTTPSS